MFWFGKEWKVAKSSRAQKSKKSRDQRWRTVGKEWTEVKLQKECWGRREGEKVVVGRMQSTCHTREEKMKS